MTHVLNSDNKLDSVPSLSSSRFDSYQTYVQNGGGEIKSEARTKEIFRILDDLAIPSTNIYGWSPDFGVDVSNRFFDISERVDLTQSNLDVSFSNGVRFCSSADRIDATLQTKGSYLLVAMGKSDGTFQTHLSFENDIRSLGSRSGSSETMTFNYNNDFFDVQPYQEFNTIAGVRDRFGVARMFINGTEEGQDSPADALTNGTNIGLRLEKFKIALYIYGDEYATQRNAELLSKRIGV